MRYPGTLYDDAEDPTTAIRADAYAASVWRSATGVGGREGTTREKRKKNEEETE
jgi:hypothetical protein